MCVRNGFIIMKWELRSYVSVYIKDQLINFKLAISNKSSLSQTNRQQTHSPYATQMPQPTLRVNLIGPRQQRYGLVIAYARRLRNFQRNIHLNLCGGAPGVSVCCTRSIKSNKLHSNYLVMILMRSMSPIYDALLDVLNTKRT